MLKELKPNIWKLNADSNIYIIKDKCIVIDAGFRTHRNLIQEQLSEIIDFKEIKTVIFTHLHMDHTGNFDLFPNAEFYASKKSIEDFKKNKIETTLDPSLAAIFNVELKPIPNNLHGIKVISTPGHTHGSICLLYKGILFTGDTKFRNSTGRTDLPTSDPSAIEKSLKKLDELEYKILAPGHDY